MFRIIICRKYSSFASVTPYMFLQYIFMCVDSFKQPPCGRNEHKSLQSICAKYKMCSILDKVFKPVQYMFLSLSVLAV